MSDGFAFIGRMRSGYVVLGKTQMLPGYCLLIADPPAVSLNALSIKKRGEFLSDMAMVGDAIIQACNPRRINYELLGNSESYLHAHIYPRYSWEDPDHITQPVASYDFSFRMKDEFLINEDKHLALKTKIERKLDELIQMGRLNEI